MLRVFAFSIATLAATGAAADSIAAFDETGAEIRVDTAVLAGCRIIFDSAGAPFEICRMKKVELTPPASTRARPGHAEIAPAERSTVVYVRTTE